MTLPQQFVNMLQDAGYAPFNRLTHILTDTPAEVSVRFNTTKSDATPTSSLEPVPWCDNAFYLSKRPAFTFDPAIHQGLYYVQDAASMFIAHVIATIAKNNVGPLLCLDACAAPGGKTTAIQSALPQDSIIVANEYVPARAAVLRENIAKWGTGDIAVTCGDTASFRRLPDTFDIIVADVPCSGEGMMRKDPEAIAQWTPELVKTCAARQREIIDNLWGALCPGGYLIYSTCTFNTAENEQMVQHIINTYGAKTIEIPIEDNWCISPAINTSIPAYRFIPGITKSEGLFLAVLQKRGERNVDKQRTASVKTSKQSALASWLQTGSPIEIISTADAFAARSISPAALKLPATMRPTTEIARIKGRDTIPTQQLALSTMLNRDAFNSCRIERQQAVEYLRGEAITLPSDTPRGITLLLYNGCPLGFAKNIGNRANNLYPTAWRIHSNPPSPLPPLPF